MSQGTEVNSAWPSLRGYWVGTMTEYQANSNAVVIYSRIPWSCNVNWCLVECWENGERRSAPPCGRYCGMSLSNATQV